MKTGHVMINTREILFIYRTYPEALYSQNGVMSLHVINLIIQAKTRHMFADTGFPWEHGIMSFSLDITFMPRRRLNLVRVL